MSFDVNRRRLVLHVGGGLSSFLISGTWRDVSAASAYQVRPLWPSEAPGGGGPAGTIILDANGAISNIAVPSLEIFRPLRPNGAAVLIAAGGGYKRIEMSKEAMPAAQWLINHGFTAYILTYRLPGEGWHAGPLAPLQDAQRALRVIRAETTGALSLLGFSAGGHLLGLAATRSAFASYHPLDALDTSSARADAVALVYPVVTLKPPFDHTSTRVQLIGRHPSMTDVADWSVETHVRIHCPPMFLIQSKDDPISNIANTAMLAAACEAAGVSVDRHILPSGGHGFGMGQPSSPTALWPGWYIDWLRAHALRA